MTTLTQNTPLRPDNCAHKLPTSCRLTARPICCACQDDRPHTPMYRKYIDGVGFVMLGTRQDGYCWPCKVFWDARIANAGIEAQRARIPFIPDQTEFINIWHDWHRGYRMIRLEGRAPQTQRLTMRQPLNQVALGSLPRPASGLSLSDPRAIPMFQRQQPPASIASRQQQDLVEIAEEDRLFDSDEDNNQPVLSGPTNQSQWGTFQSSEVGSDISVNNSIDTTMAQADSEEEPPIPELPTPPARSMRALISRLENLSSSINATSERLRYVLDLYGLPEVTHGELRRRAQTLGDVADQVVRQSRELTNYEVLLDLSTRTRPTTNPQSHAISYSTSTRDLNSSSSNQHINRNRLNSFLPPPHLLTQSRSLEQRALDRRERRNAVTERQSAVFGTREDVQQPSYESPINLMFERANLHGQRVQRERLEQQQAEQRARSRREQQLQIQRLQTQQRQVQQIQAQQFQAQQAQSRMQAQAQQQQQEVGTEEDESFLDRAVQLHNSLASPLRPLEPSEMSVQLECTICQEQIADIALVPCGHMAMCRWCSGSHAEMSTEQSGGRRVAATCPVCRAVISRRLRIWGISGDGGR